MIISLIKFRTSGGRPSCAHELEKYWACPQRKTGLHRGWLIVNKMGGMFPRQPVEHQQCHHALLAVKWPGSVFAVHSEPQKTVACHKAQWIHGRCRLNINNSANIACSPLFPPSFMPSSVQIHSQKGPTGTDLRVKLDLFQHRRFYPHMVR